MFDGHFRRDFQPVRGELLRSPLPLSRKTFRPIRRAENQVLGDGELAHQRIVLINGRKAQSAHVQRIGGDHRLSHDRNTAFVGGHRTGGDAEQCALSGAVFAENSVDFPRAALEVDPIKRQHAGIAL